VCRCVSWKWTSGRLPQLLLYVPPSSWKSLGFLSWQQETGHTEIPTDASGKSRSLRSHDVITGSYCCMSLKIGDEMYLVWLLACKIYVCVNYTLWPRGRDEHSGPRDNDVQAYHGPSTDFDGMAVTTTRPKCVSRVLGMVLQLRCLTS
jgi:hypothetical protein